MQTPRALMFLATGILACGGDGGTDPAGVAYRIEVYNPGWCSGGTGDLVLCGNADVTDVNDEPVIGAHVTLAVDEGDVLRPEFALTDHTGAVAFLWEAHYHLGIRHLYGCARSDWKSCEPALLFTFDYPFGSVEAPGSWTSPIRVRSPALFVGRSPQPRRYPMRAMPQLTGAGGGP